MGSIDNRADRVAALQVKPLRYNPAAPIVGKNGAKPFRPPDGNVKTVPLKFLKHKPLRGLK